MTENEAIKILKKPTEHIKIYDDDFVFSSDFAKAYEVAIKALEENQQYKTIGTVEEFKVLKEKGVAKKPLCISIAKDKDTNVGSIGRCPCCDYIVAEDMLWCDDCGQKLNWQ